VLGALGEIVFPEKGCARKAAKDAKKNNRLRLRFSLGAEQGRTQPHGSISDGSYATSLSSIGEFYG
jgi:hypothetical protein